jgi:hypothetical protein
VNKVSLKDHLMMSQKCHGMRRNAAILFLANILSGKRRLINNHFQILQSFNTRAPEVLDRRVRGDMLYFSDLLLYYLRNTLNRGPAS